MCVELNRILDLRFELLQNMLNPIKKSQNILMKDVSTRTPNKPYAKKRQKRKIKY
jgi:hypothetical protein